MYFQILDTIRIVRFGFSRVFVCALVVGCSVLSPLAFSIDEEKDLFDLSFEELLNVKISTGSLTRFATKYSPSAITTIQADQIELATARNLATLLEQYVPGMMLMTHSEGDKIGIRGLIAAENYKLLLLVNGVNITNNVYEGAMMELDQWELGDIERIEIIRGPGSVTYGSGAIAGVINIITKSSETRNPEGEISVAYAPTYGSKGFSLQTTRDVGDWGVYFYGSVRESDGYDDPRYFVLSGIDAAGSRYLGERGSDEKGPQPYLADSLGRPQVKVHLDMSNGDDFRIWARYTQSGQAHNFSTFAANRDMNGNLIADAVRRQVSIRNFAISPEYTRELSDTLGMKLRFSYDDQEYIRYDYLNVDWPIDHFNNIRDYAFSQNRLVGSVLFDYDSGEKLRVATGFEYNSTAIHAPWGRGADSIWIREGEHIISDVDSSVYLRYPGLLNRPNPNSVEEVGGGLRFDTVSQLSEVSYDLSSGTLLVYAHRVDVPEIADVMFAPRLSLIHEFEDDSTVRLSAQRSLRMMPLRAQYLYDKYDRETSTSKNDYESLDSLEVAYTKVITDDLLFELNAFYNDTETVGFTSTDLQFLGDLRLLGVELQVKANVGNTELTFNHSFVDMLNMTMNPDLKTGSNRNNITYSDYYYNTSGDVPLLLEGYGNDLNNWSTNSSRLIVTSRFLDDSLTLHVGARLNWDYKGSYDEMGMYQRAYDTFDTSGLDSAALAAFQDQRAIFERERSLLDAEDAYKSDLRVNASLSYTWDAGQDTQVLATLFAENLFGPIKRYYVSTGSSRFYPERLSFMEEPRSVGIRISVKYR